MGHGGLAFLSFEETFSTFCWIWVWSVQVHTCGLLGGGTVGSVQIRLGWRGTVSVVKVSLASRLFPRCRHQVKPGARLG